MAALNALPNKLWRPLGEVKAFVEKMSNGVRLPQMSQKIKSFASLSRKDKDILIRYLDERDCINVIQARPLKGGNLCTFFFHQKYPLPSTIPGYDWNGIKPKRMMPVEDIPKHLLPDVDDSPEPDEVDEPEPVPEIKLAEPVASVDEPETDDDTRGNQAEDLRKRALQMLMEADKADSDRTSNLITNELKPKIDDFIARLNVANDAVQSTLDTLYDQMGEVDKISMEFKKFCSSL